MFTNIDEAINWIYKQKSSKYSFINFKKLVKNLEIHKIVFMLFMLQELMAKVQLLII